MVRRSHLIALAALLLASLAATGPCTGQENDLKPAATFAGGQSFTAGPVHVLRLAGTYRQMGRQYGRLLGKELRAFYRLAIEDEYIGRQGYTFDQLLRVGRQVLARYPKRYRDILEGMAQTSGLDLDRQIVLNAAEWIPKLALPAPHCSGIAVWGDYTGGRPLVFGRNNDDSAFFKRFAPWVVVVVLDPGDGSIPMAFVNYAGVVYAPSGMNAEGVFLELNSGNSMGYYPERVSIFTTLVSFLQDYATLDELEAAFQSTKPELSVIVNAADLAGAASFECSPAQAKRRAPDEPGLMVATNHFVDPAWSLAPPDDATNAWTVTRRRNLLRLAAEHEGSVNVATMQRILETTIEEGGGTDAAGTIYQIIAVPETLTLWLRAPGTFDWQRVPLARALRGGSADF